ncbi:heat shock protein beta-6 isoform X1 [Conger conger]|uniref:heat shock protein beta-6 isoform X1 n=1 Tax=Conger conger TaxID=82655 RepID=UPI002A5A5501|nr:heat shock protein beta-6 isoform X1 [Conger conger]
MFFYHREMDFDLPPSLPLSGIPWERVLSPLIPQLSGTLGPYTWVPSEFQMPATELTGSSRASPITACDRSGFTVQVDVKHFSPEELMVKVTGDFIEVHGKHEQKKDGPGLVSRQFNRRYRIPEGVDVAALESAVSPEGILVICAPLLQGESSRPLPHTGP